MTLSLWAWADIMAAVVIIVALTPVDRGKKSHPYAGMFQFILGLAAALWLLFSASLNGCVFNVCL